MVYVRKVLDALVHFLMYENLNIKLCLVRNI